MDVYAQPQACMVLILAVMVALGLTGRTEAAEVQLSVQNMATVSDNISRMPHGTEASGSLLTMQGDLTISSDLGRGHVELVAGGGLETTNDDQAADNENFNFQLNVNLPWSRNGYLEGTASTSDETQEPEINDISQVRVRTRTSRTGLAIGNQATSTFSWRMGASNRTEKRFDRDLEESEAEAGWDLDFDPRRSMSVDITFSDGKEQTNGNTWDDSSVLIDMRKQVDRATSRGYRLTWEGQDLQRADGTIEWSDIASAQIYYEVQMPSGWSFSGDLGLEGVNPPYGERRLEPMAHFALGSAPERRMRFSGSFSTSSEIQDPLDDEVSWSRNSQAQAGLTWNVSRLYSVIPRVQFYFTEQHGDEDVERTDETLILRLETRWAPARNWFLGLNAHKEDRTSTRDVYDLSESRLELTFSGTFF